MSKFVHLHTHSHYSLLDGLGKIPDLVKRAKVLGMDSLALTDHGVMYGAIEFYKECVDQGIKPIIGTEIYISPRRMEDKTPRIDSKPYHLVLLAKDKTGYQNLLKIVTQAHLVGFYYRPRVDKAFLKNNSKGLIALTACLWGEISQLIISKNLKKAEETIYQYQDIFGKDNFYLELQDHPELKEQNIVNKGLIELAKKTKSPLVATCDIHYINPQDREAHEVLLAVQTGKDLDDKSRMSLEEVNLYMRTPEEIAQAFKDTPEAIENTAKIAKVCNLELEFGNPILPEFKLPKGETPKSSLERNVYEGAKKRFNEITPEIKKRIDYELEVIEKTHFEDYFLIVADYVNFAKTHQILVGPGRGSAAGSIVSYCLNITDLDPLEYDLLFERFLNPERIAPPDIDLDFADNRRDEVIQYISKKYGADHVAQIITFGTMASRGSIRDTGRALGITYSDVDKIAKLIPFGLTLKQSLETVSELKDLYNQDSQAKKLLNMAQKLEGVARHASTHAAGIVISKDALANYVPLQFSTRGTDEIITQYAMNELEAVGLIKMDILGLANLSIMENAIKIARKTQDAKIDINNIPLNDPKTYELLAKAETTGVFQLESDGMKRNLKDLKPSDFEDIIAMVALYRPGPMRLIPDYIKGKHGKTKTSYIHPKLEPILKNTYGIAVYQEQVLQIAREIAGFSLGEADILRKAIGKKIRKLLMEQKIKFISGAIKKGTSKKIAEKIFDFVEPFAEYGFNRAHAACYAMVAYQTAYLKTHFPSEFMAALLTSDQNNLDKLSVATSEAERMKIKVLPPDINESFVEFGVVKDTQNIRFGLAAIKNVGAGAAESIVEERKQKGVYKNLKDFLDRLGNKVLNKKIIEALTKTGTLDNFAERNQILMNIDLILKFISSKESAPSNQMGLFGKSEEADTEFKLAEIEPAAKKQRLSWEKELLGMYVSEHPLKGMEKKLKTYARPLDQIPAQEGRNIKAIGIITSISKIITRSNEPMIFASLEDTTAKTEVLVFPKILKKDNIIWRTDNIVLVEGRTNTKDGALKIIAESVKEIHFGPLSDKPNQLVLTLPSSSKKDILSQIKKTLEKFPGDIPVILKIPQNGGLKEFKTKTKALNDPILFKELTNLLGEGMVELE